MSRLPRVFLDFQYVSYVVYVAFSIALGAYAIRLLTRNHPLPLITNPWLWIFVVVVVAGGIHGLSNIDGIPPWMFSDAEDVTSPRVYLRNVLMPSVALPVLSMMIAAAIVDREKLSTFIAPMIAFAWIFALSILVMVALSPQSLIDMAQATERSEHLTSLGFHSNELGTLMAVAYAFSLGLQTARRTGAYGWLIRLLPIVTAVAMVLTFSRGAYAAFVVTNAVFFLRGSASQKLLIATVFAIALLVAPAAISDRINFGLDSRDPNVISAGRVDSLWLPLLPDIAEHIFLGQGLNSIMWTDAQQQQLIFAVSLAHNGYLDLALDLGLIGGVLVLGWYFYLWYQSAKYSAEDPDPEYRGLFSGCQLSILSLFVSAVTNDRFTPTAANCLIWISAGIAIGRALVLQRSIRRGAPSLAQRRVVGSVIQPRA